jgi:methylmalonyl-CoA mutase
MKEGELPVSFDTTFDEMKALIDWKNNNDVNLSVIGISGIPYHNAGSSAVQELAFAMATAVEYINKMEKRGVDTNDVINNIVFTFGVGPFYFMEIAKLRAAKVLWNQIVEAYGMDKEDAKIKVHAVTSGYNQTVYDPYVNMLRTTTEAFSAVVGGVESLTTNHFDQVFGMPDKFSRRISRNTQIILNEESHLNKLIDPAGGSYFVENLTKEVAESAWRLFQSIENNEGMLKAIQDEFPHNEIEKVVEARKKDVRKRKSVIVGTNMYANLTEEKLPDKEKDLETIFNRRTEYLQKYRVSGNQEKHNSILKKLQKLVDSENGAELFKTGIEAALEGATIGEISKSLRSHVTEKAEVKKLNIHRISELFEELRDRSARYENKYGRKPKVFLAAMGPVNQHKARADFSRGFFEVGGFEVEYQGPKGFENPEDAVKAAVESEAHVVTICSTDDTYPELVPSIVKELRQQKENMITVLAGYPKDQIEEHKKNGIDEFIYLGADAYAILENLLKKIGA